MLDGEPLRRNWGLPKLRIISRSKYVLPSRENFRTFVAMKSLSVTRRAFWIYGGHSSNSARFSERSEAKLIAELRIPPQQLRSGICPDSPEKVLCQAKCFTVAIVQLVRTLGCGPRGRGFKSHWPPKYNERSTMINEQRKEKRPALVIVSFDNCSLLIVHWKSPHRLEA